MSSASAASIRCSGLSDQSPVRFERRRASRNRPVLASTRPGDGLRRAEASAERSIVFRIPTFQIFSASSNQRSACSFLSRKSAISAAARSPATTHELEYKNAPKP